MMAARSSEDAQLPSPDVRAIQKLLYQHLMEETLTTELLQEFEQYLDRDIIVKACSDCANTDEFVDFEECIYGGEVSGSTLEEHLNLIENGYCYCTDVDSKDKITLVGFKLLHKMARKDNYLPFLTFLHEHKCDLDAQTWRLQETAVGIAIRLEQVEVLKFLVRNGADVNMYSNPERHTLPLYDAVQTRNIEILQTLLSAKTINVNPIEEWPSRWILVHCINIFPDGVESLLRAGADPNASGRYGGTPLAASAISKNTEMVKLLIQYGASVNFEDSMTQAPLQHSVTAGDIATVAVLLEAGADPNARRRSDNKSLITLASYKGFSDIINLLIKYGGNVNLVSNREYSALHIAAWEGHCETVRILHDNGADFDKQTADKNTPLALAAHGGHIDVIKYLLQLGCDINNVDRDGDTPLFYLVQRGSAEGVKLLLENGADPEICDSANTSPLWTAVYQNHKEVVKQLLLANVKMEVPSRGMDRRPWNDQIYYFYDSPKSPLYVAVDHHNLDVAVLLIKAGYNVSCEMWLVERDFPESEDWEEVSDTLMQYIQIPLSLMALCRNHLRRCLGRDIHQRVETLCIPSSLKDYVTLKLLSRSGEKQTD